MVIQDCFNSFLSRLLGPLLSCNTDSECRNCAASAESFTLDALRFNISVSKSFNTLSRIPVACQFDEGRQPFEIPRANANASNNA
jgi:hypothetical protein